MGNAEAIKRNSRGLRGTLAEELDVAGSRFSDENVPLLKFQGAYQGDDVMIPSRRLVLGFTEVAQPIFDQIGNLTVQNQKLRAARDLLLPKLISGEIVV